jgi:tight adherence protein B
MAFALLTRAIPILLAVLALGGAFLSVRRKRLEVERRFRLISQTGGKQPADGGPPVSRASQAAKLGSHIKYLFTFGAGYSWGMNASARLLTIAAFVSAAAVWFLTKTVIGLPAWLAVLASAGGLFIGPRIVLHRQQERAKREFIYLFPDAVDTVARMLRGGIPMTFAIQAVGNEAPPPVNKVFGMIADQIKIGIPVAEALDTQSQQIAVPDFRFFAVAAIMQYSTGGNLITTLEDLSQIMRKRHVARLRARAVTAEIRFSAYVLGSLPFLVVSALLVIDPGYLTPLFHDRRGHFILALAGTCLSLAFLTMRQMIRSVSSE